MSRLDRKVNGHVLRMLTPLMRSTRVSASVAVALVALPPALAQPQVPGVPLHSDPSTPVGLSVASYASVPSRGAGGGTAVAGGPAFRIWDLTVAAYGGQRWRDDGRSYPVLGGTMSIHLVPLRRSDGPVTLAVQVGLATEAFALDPDASLTSAVPAQRTSTLDVVTGLRFRVAGLRSVPGCSSASAV